MVEATKELKLDVTAVADRIKAYQARYDIAATVIDNANKQAVMEMQNRHGLQLTPAEKTGKMDFIELMNGDLIQGYVKLLPAAQPLKEEWAELILNDKSDKREEHPGCSNHCADGALYGWRHAYSYLSTRAPVTPPAHGSDAWRERERARLAAEGERLKEEALEQALEAQREREENEAWL